jgi:hypothetical protein
MFFYCLNMQILKIKKDMKKYYFNIFLIKSILISFFKKNYLSIFMNRVKVDPITHLN